jgi:hypothetical protein
MKYREAKNVVTLSFNKSYTMQEDDGLPARIRVDCRRRMRRVRPGLRLWRLSWLEQSPGQLQLTTGIIRLAHPD